jgi:hypothetical protein
MVDANRLAQLAGGALHRSLADSIGNPKACWCVICDREQAIDAAHCFRHGWPKCCGMTMTTDRARLKTGG